MSKPKRYDPAAIETKWQSRWENEKTYACHVDKDKKKYYVLEMFPYPSGNLHMGHVRNYSIGDVVARFKRMQGFNVMHPMGWDAFGLPAENAAIKHNIHPSVWTHANIDNMRAQLKRLGYSYDWDREVATCDEPYYRWEQLFFLRWLEKGLVYRKKASQNWCPHCNTVLANEQVVDGLCWRCDTPVVQKELTQWFLKITDYADELLADLSKLEGGWPDRVLSMQRNWIGKSVGAEITFPLESGEGDIKVFTTRPDTVFGVTFMTLAPEHPLVESLISGKPNEAEARAFIERTHNMDRIDRQSDSLEKEGVFTGSYCLNPFTGRQVPIWLGNFVLAEYGTGAVMAVPAHDQRDFDFSKKYGMELQQRGIEVGVRVETHNDVMSDLTNVIYDPTFFVQTQRYDDQTRTFCTNPAGFITLENYQDFVCVNGHAYRNRKSDNTNFAFLSKVILTDPVSDSHGYGVAIGRLASLIGGGKPILQRLGDLRRGRRSTWQRIHNGYVEPTLTEVTPGDIAMALPGRIVTNLVEGLEQLNLVVPGIADDSTLLYAPEIKFFSTQVATSSDLETSVSNLFVAGDGPGVSGNIVSAAATGIIPAKAIVRKFGKGEGKE